MTEEANQTAEAPAEAPAGSAVPKTGLNLEDLKVVCGAIEIGANRGAYRPNEFKVIGEVWERVTAFIKATEPKVAEAEAKAQEGEVNVEPVNAEPVAEVTEDNTGS